MDDIESIYETAQIYPDRKDMHIDVSKLKDYDRFCAHHPDKYESTLFYEGDARCRKCFESILKKPGFNLNDVKVFSNQSEEIINSASNKGNDIAEHMDIYNKSKKKLENVIAEKARRLR